MSLYLNLTANQCQQRDSTLNIQEAIAAESQHLQKAAVEAESVMLERIHTLEEVMFLDSKHVRH